MKEKLKPITNVEKFPENFEIFENFSETKKKFQKFFFQNSDFLVLFDSTRPFDQHYIVNCQLYA